MPLPFFFKVENGNLESLYCDPLKSEAGYVRITMNRKGSSPNIGGLQLLKWVKYLLFGVTRGLRMPKLSTLLIQYNILFKSCSFLVNLLLNLINWEKFYIIFNSWLTLLKILKVIFIYSYSYFHKKVQKKATTSNLTLFKKWNNISFFIKIKSF